MAANVLHQILPAASLPGYLPGAVCQADCQAVSAHSRQFKSKHLCSSLELRGKQLCSICSICCFSGFCSFCSSCTYFAFAEQPSQATRIRHAGLTISFPDSIFDDVLDAAGHRVERLRWWGDQNLIAFCFKHGGQCKWQGTQIPRFLSKS